MLEKNLDINGLKASDIMSKNPKKIEANEMAVNVIKVMQNHGISQILVVDNNKYIGVLHFHDLLKEGFI
jgi:arabinose-5-phosphate isomerase